MTWVMQRIQHMMCGLRGHDTVLQFERHRLSLRCLSCGYETTGWSLRPDASRGPSQADRFSPSHVHGLRPWQRAVDAIGRRAAA
jgi:hypothetical protein